MLPPEDVPPEDELILGATALIERHFAAINAGDRATFRETVYLFEQNDGQPFETWWARLRSLAPLSVSLKPGSVSDHVSVGKEPHVSVWIEVDATSAVTRQVYRGDFVVWYLTGSRTWKLGCRVHW
jgi:hypothetical protein